MAKEAKEAKQTKESQEAKETKEAKEKPAAENAAGEQAGEGAAEAAAEPAAGEAAEPNPFEEKYLAEHDTRLRLAAEFENYRKRTAKEKDAAYSHGKSDAVEKILPVYDNLYRALQQHTEDAAFKKGVEMTMTELVKILTALGVEIFGAVGDSFDPNLHNAVMHTEDESKGEGEIVQVFQQGFRLGDKIVRFATVQVAN
ncbi:MAG: nucleotide exchange factor GrpE [Firmicutes bacterium]|nr:nucleotide exchange factor GrpE [Bacillota bacterium]